MSASKSKNAKMRKKSVAKKIRKNKLGFVAAVSFVMVIALLSANIWNNWVKIGKKNEEALRLESEYNSKRIKNDALQQKVNAPVDDEYIMDVARDNGYRKSDEILFYLNSDE